MVVAVPAAVAGAACMGLASAAQARATKQVPVSRTLHPRLFVDLVHAGARGDVATSRPLQERISDLWTLFTPGTTLPALYAACAALGLGKVPFVDYHNHAFSLLVDFARNVGILGCQSFAGVDD